MVTFTNNVVIIGDGSVNETSISDKQLEDFDFIKKNGVACSTTTLNKPISATVHNLE